MAAKRRKKWGKHFYTNDAKGHEFGGMNTESPTPKAQHRTSNTEPLRTGGAGVGQTFQSAGSRNFPVPCFQLQAIGQVRTRAASRMNGRLESRPTGRLESLPYESARMVFSGG
jgi:hypothetical protein